MKEQSNDELKAQIEALKKALIASELRCKKESEKVQKLSVKINRYEEILNKVRENYDISKYLIFGAQSETREGKQFNDDLKDTVPSINEIDDSDLGPSPEQEAQRVVKRWGRQNNTKTTGRDMSFKTKLEESIVINDIREDLKDSVLKDELIFIKKETHSQVDFVNSYIKTKTTVTYLYKNKRTGALVKASPKEHDIIRGGKLTNSFISSYITDRILWGTPYYRQAKRLNLIAGCNAVNAQLLTRVALNVSGHLSYIGEHLFKSVTSSKTLHADETRLLVIHDNANNERKQGFLWMLSCAGKHPVSYCRFYPTRKASCAKDLLASCKGIALQVDGYGAYSSVVKEMNNIYATEIAKTEGDDEAKKFLENASDLLDKGILLVGCMAHARRRFFRAYEVSYKNKPKSLGGITCNRIMDLISELYKIEDDLRNDINLNEEDFVKKRKEKAIPIIFNLKKFAKERKPLHKAENKLSEALSYLLNQIDSIANYLETPELTPDNNSQERLIKTICTTRKNSLFASTEEGAASWALFHSLLQTAVMNNVNPTLYLKHIIDEVAKANDENINCKDMDWESLMPWNCGEKFHILTK